MTAEEIHMKSRCTFSAFWTHFSVESPGKMPSLKSSVLCFCALKCSKLFLTPVKRYRSKTNNYYSEYLKGIRVTISLVCFLDSRNYGAVISLAQSNSLNKTILFPTIGSPSSRHYRQPLRI